MNSKNQVLQDSELANIKNYIPNEADIGRRVLCLYRVSDDKQVTYDEQNQADIPMQRRECRRYLEQQGWILVHEEREDGISGHKVRAEKRDSVQIIKELATTKKFDILLVFLFDRIGRIADETPFVVEWLVLKGGVRVWSVNEGEQRFENHTDKLTNYIRYWQAHGESEKTSIRTKAGLGLLVEDGHYKGGTPPYGYTLVKSGRLDKKKNEKKNLAVLEEEAVIVQKIYDLYVNYGHGVQRIATLFAKEGIKNRSGKTFHYASINHILKNLTYTGILRSGESRSPVIEALQIIPPEVFQKARDIMEKRKADAADGRTYPHGTDSRCLLNGKVYCAHCGARLVVATNGRYTVENGVKQKRLRYLCYGKVYQRNGCEGQTGYASTRLDGVVDSVIRRIFESMQSVSRDEVVNSSFVSLKQELTGRHKTIEREYKKSAGDLATLKSEVLNAIRGESKFAPEVLNELIAQAEQELVKTQSDLANIRRELAECEGHIKEMEAKYDEVISWTELYDSVELPAKKMIVANLIRRIEVGVDYQLQIGLNIDLEHFGIQSDICDFTKERTA